MTEYREAMRRASERELVKIIDSYDVPIGNIYEVVSTCGGLIYVNGSHTDGSPLNLFESEYVVLEPIDDEKRDGTLRQEIEDLRENLRRFAEQSAQNAGDIEELQQSTQAAFDELNGKIGHLEDAVEDTEDVEVAFKLGVLVGKEISK